jgi:2-polyprenyl-3-methyl-5-hydroxy-6-metoxy-1,4-benzoquinol methylase
MKSGKIIDEVQKPSVDELLVLIRKEARYLEAEGLSLFDEAGSGDPLQDMPIWVEENFKFPLKSVYHCNEFLVYDDIEFVLNVYRGIFRRVPDESGFDSYVALLRETGEKILRDEDAEKLNQGDEQGLKDWKAKRDRYHLEQKKLHILRDMMSSGEARIHKTRVRGLRWAFWEIKLKEMGYFNGRIGKIFNIFKYRLQDDQHDVALDTERRRLQHQKKTEAYLKQQYRQFETTTQWHHQLESEHRQLIAKVERYRRDLSVAQQGLISQQRRIDVMLGHGLIEFDGVAVASAKTNRIDLSSDKLDAFYMAFENECRGDETVIREQLSVHLAKVVACVAVTEETPLLDIGSGRGEWLSLLKAEGIPAAGIDISQVLAAHCKDLGLTVIVADAVEHLKSMADNSLGAITAMHVIEHLDFDQLFAFIEECQRVLAPGGMVVFETPNPENLLVASHTFYHDPTHRNPVTPTLISFLVRYLGFVDTNIERLHPYPAEDKVLGFDTLTERVNGHLLGPQDYALVAYKTADER